MKAIYEECKHCKGTGKIKLFDIIGKYCDGCKYRSQTSPKGYCSMGIKMIPTKRYCCHKTLI